MADRKLNQNRCNACGKIVDIGPDGLVPAHAVLRGSERPCAGVGFLPQYDDEGNQREPEEGLLKVIEERRKVIDDLRRRGRR